jgi:integrase
MGTICAKTGLRISEVLGLKWGDIDATTGQAGVLRSVVDGAVGRCKTETSQQPVPLDELTLGELQSWREVTMYAADSDWVFASLREDAALWAVSSLQKVLQPAAILPVHSPDLHSTEHPRNRKGLNMPLNPRQANASKLLS